MIYVITTLLIIIIVLIAYIVISSRIKDKRYQMNREKTQAQEIDRARPTDITPVRDEIKNVEEKRNEIKNSNADADALFDALNGRR